MKRPAPTLLYLLPLGVALASVLAFVLTDAQSPAQLLLWPILAR